MSEKASYRKFVKAVKMPRDRIERVENLIVIGMPDVNYCIEGVEGWIEIKSPKEPKRKTTKLFGSNHKLSQDQMNWLLKQRNACGRCWVLIETDKVWILISGTHADKINDLSVLELINICSWCAEIPVQQTQWALLRDILKCK